MRTHSPRALLRAPSVVWLAVLICATAIAVVLAIAQPCAATTPLMWGDAGAIVCDEPGEKRNLRTAPDGAGGIYYVWEDLRGGVARIYAQRVDSLGARLWTAAGVAVFSAAVEQIDAVATADAAGNLCVVARERQLSGAYDLYAQKLLRASGAAQWGSNGYQVCTFAPIANKHSPSVTADGADGIVVAWVDLRTIANPMVYAQRVTMAGRVWNPTGVLLSTELPAQEEPRAMRTTSGEFVFFWRQGTDLRAQSLTGGGARRWGVIGVAVAPMIADKSDPRAVAGSAGDALAVWREASGDIRAQRLDTNGAWLWGAGVTLGSVPGGDDPVAATDAAGGLYAAWEGGGAGSKDLYVQRAAQDGALLLGSSGKVLASAAGDQYDVAIDPDGHQGVFAGWLDARDGAGATRFYSQWVDSTGISIWKPDGIAVTNRTSGPSVCACAMSSMFLAAGQIAGAGNSVVVGQGLTEGWIADIFVNYDDGHFPTPADATALGNLLGAEHVGYRCKNIEMICARRVGSSSTDDIGALANVAGTEFALRVKHCLDISTRAIKARASDTYSPSTVEDLGYDGTGIRVAILDSGVDDGHASLSGKYVAGFNAVTDTEGNPDDDLSENDTYHGTHCAGIVMGTDDTYRGVAPGAELVDVKVLGADGSGSGEDVCQGIDWCIEHKNDYEIRVLSMSLGSLVPSDGRDAQSKLVNAAVDAGLVVVAAAGNTGVLGGIGTPAAADKAIVIAAMDDVGTINRADDDIANFSTRGPRRSDNDADLSDEKKPDVAAPGVDIMAPKGAAGDPGNNFQNMSGTSMATPHVAGVVALMLDANPNRTPAEVKSILQRTCDDWSSDGCGTECPSEDPKWDRCFGYGYVDAYKAVQSAIAGDGSICHWISYSTPHAHNWLGWHFVHGDGTIAVWVNNRSTAPTEEATLTFFQESPTLSPRYFAVPRVMSPQPIAGSATWLGAFLVPPIAAGESLLVGPVEWQPPSENDFGEPYFAVAATVTSNTDPLFTASPMNDNNVAVRAHWALVSELPDPRSITFRVQNVLCEECKIALTIDREELPAGWSATFIGIEEGVRRTFAPGEELVAQMTIYPDGAGSGTAHALATQWAAGSPSQLVRDLGGLALTVDVQGTGVPDVEEALVTRLLPIVTQPARGTARIRFTLAQGDAARVEIFDASGRLVNTLWRGAQPGLHEVAWPGNSPRAASGIYWVRLSTQKGAQIERLVLIR